MLPADYTCLTSWDSRPNPEDRINRKPGDQKNNQRTENAKKRKAEKMNSTFSNLLLGPIFFSQFLRVNYIY